jgi:ferredoxin-nitrate reductase
LARDCWHCGDATVAEGQAVRSERIVLRSNSEVDHRATYGEAICPYCGVGCRLWAEMAYGSVLRVKGADAPANLGRICAKGATLDQTIATPDRAVQPLVRATRSRELRPTTWDAAFEDLARRFTEIIARHGPDSVAFYGSGQLDSEAVYAAVKLFKGSLGTNNTDSNSRLCMATAVAGYRTSLGSDGPPTCYDDIDAADTIVLVGSNMAEAHPVTFDRIKAQRKARPELTLVVIDPRRTATADFADVHLAVRPGGDIALCNALAKLLIERHAVDAAFIDDHTRGFAEFHEAIDALTLDELAKSAGMPIAQLDALAELLAAGRKWLSFYCMGLGQSAVGMWKINSLINLHLLTGSIGKPGCGPFSLTGQPNAMGGREIGLLAHQLPAYRFVDNAKHRGEVEDYWRRPAGTISSRPGLTAIEMFRALERGTLKAIWIAATNPAVSLPDLHHVRRALDRAELVVVQDAFHPTETSEFADFVLPAASWGEKQWTSTNSERMVAQSDALVAGPGAALADWQILCRFAQRLGYAGFDFKHSGEVWDEWIGLTGNRPCDMRGMTSARLARVKNLQWPCPVAEHPGTKRLYQDQRFAHSDGRAVFLYRAHHGPKEPSDHEFPLTLTTGRVYAHWHTLTRTGKVRQLAQREPGPFVQIHPALAGKLNVADGEQVQVSSRRGTVQLAAQVTDRVPEDIVFVPMHWGDLHAPGNAANYLTISATGRVAKQPELKCCAVALEKIETLAVDQGARGAAHGAYQIAPSNGNGNGNGAGKGATNGHAAQPATTGGDAAS